MNAADHGGPFRPSRVVGAVANESYIFEVIVPIEYGHPERLAAPAAGEKAEAPPIPPPRYLNWADCITRDTIFRRIIAIKEERTFTIESFREARGRNGENPELAANAIID
jgi:hypothetical protein